MHVEALAFSAAVSVSLWWWTENVILTILCYQCTVVREELSHHGQ